MLIRLGHDEATILREVKVRDRTFRRWKKELERYGHVGKPPECRTGRRRVLTPEIEQALFEHVEANPQMSVDDMLWWLHETYELVVSGRTVRRVFEKRNEARQKLQSEGEGGQEEGTVVQPAAQTSTTVSTDERPNTLPQGVPYQSPYAPTTPAATAPAPAPTSSRTTAPSRTTAAEPHSDAAEEAALEASLAKLNKQKRAIEQKLKALRERRSAPAPAPSPAPSPAQASPDPATSTTKAKAREARMLNALQTRSRKRSNLTASWVEGREHWPIGPQTVLEEAMKRYSGYDDEALVQAVYEEVYAFVDAEGWERGVHDELLWERTRRKIATVKVHGFPSQVHMPKGQPEGERLLSLAHSGQQAVVGGSAYPTADAGGQAQFHHQGATGSSLEQELQHAMAGAN
ncbi:hypothetical protein MBLNU457_1504t1 [Dothideomycetes sp. NU457]